MSYMILYVEDESAIIELVELVVKHSDITLFSAFSADHGLKLIREKKPDLVILDVMMPDRSGWSVYAELRADANLSKVPIIMLTGQMHRYKVKKDFEKSTIDAYITKPFDVSAIRTEIEKMLGVTFWSTPLPAAPKSKARETQPAKRRSGHERKSG
jgi:DNA-binding response OmpR family regulator